MMRSLYIIEFVIFLSIPRFSISAASNDSSNVLAMRLVAIAPPARTRCILCNNPFLAMYNFEDTAPISIIAMFSSPSIDPEEH